VPVGDVQVPVIGNDSVIPLLVVPHILIAAFVIGINLIGAFSELTGVITKKAHYDRFARASARFTLLLFAVGSALAFTFLLSLITLYPIFFSQLMNIFFWVFLAEAFMFVGEVIMVYAWYHSWDRMAYRKNLHVVFGLVGGLFGLTQMIFIDVVASYMLTPSTAQATDVGWTFLNPTYITLNLHRFVGNFSYAGFLIAGWAAWRYLRVTREEDREYYDWMGHWGIVWGFGFLILQPFMGYGYMTEIKAASPGAFEYLMLGPKSWLFNLLTIEILVMAAGSVLYCLHKLNFAVKPMPRLRKATVGALGFTVLFGLLNVIPADGYLVPQIGLVFGEKVDPNISLAARPPISLGAMYPWKYIGLIGIAFVGVFALGLYLKAAASGFEWGRASRWSQYILIATAVTVVSTMMTMGYARETARRAGNGKDDGWLIYNCLTLQQQKFVGAGCPEQPRETP
jgi:cytochrome d ubiquinol oxidase subunit I